MIIESLSNPVYSAADNSHITCTIHTDALGTIPFTAAANDSEVFGKNLYQALVAGQYGLIAPYVGSIYAANAAAIAAQAAAQSSIPDVSTQLANLTAAVTALGGTLPSEQITAANATLTAIGSATIVNTLSAHL